MGVNTNKTTRNKRYVSKNDTKLDDNDHLNFLQKGAQHITCYDCGKNGHYTGILECPKTNKNLEICQVTMKNDLNDEDSKGSNLG